MAVSLSKQKSMLLQKISKMFHRIGAFLTKPIVLKVKKKSKNTDWACVVVRELRNSDRYWTFNHFYMICIDINLAIWKANGFGSYGLLYWHDGNTQKICEFNLVDQFKIHKAIKIATKNSLEKYIEANDYMNKQKKQEKEYFERQMGE